MNKYFIEFLACIIICVTIGGLVLLVLHDKVVLPWSETQLSRRRTSQACCMDVPCSEECARRHQAIQFVSAIDGARYNKEIQDLILRGFQQEALPAPGDDDRVEDGANAR